MAVSPPSFEERLFGPLVTGRECGPCTACCVEIQIDDPMLAKPARERCVNCTSDGCAVYPVRPRDCRNWYCAWRRVGILSEELRPDRCGFLISVVENPGSENPLMRLYVIVQWLDAQPITRSVAADEALAAMRRLALPVWVGSGERMSLHHPRQEIALHLIEGTTPPSTIAEEVAAWRTRIPR